MLMALQVGQLGAGKWPISSIAQPRGTSHPHSVQINVRPACTLAPSHMCVRWHSSVQKMRSPLTVRKVPRSARPDRWCSAGIDHRTVIGCRCSSPSVSSAAESGPGQSHRILEITSMNRHRTTCSGSPAPMASRAVSNSVTFRLQQARMCGIGRREGIRQEIDQCWAKA